MGNGFRTSPAGGVAAPPYTIGPYTFSEDITFEGDLTVEGDLTFGDTSTDELTINGFITYGVSTADYMINMVASTPAVADIILSNSATIANGAAGTLTITETAIELVGTVKLDGTVTFDDDGTLTDASDVMTITQETITLVGATAVNLTGPTVQSGSFTMDSKTAGNVFSLAAFGDGSGLVMTDSYLDAAAFFMELPSGGAAITAGNVLRGIRTRFLINQAQTNNISIYANTGHIRVKANLAAGVHVGQMCYYEQSGTVAIATSGIEAAMAATIETESTFTLDAGALACAGYFSSNVNAGATINGEFVGVQFRKGGGMLDFVSGIEFTDCVSSEIFKFADDQTICSDDNQAILVDISGTANDGFVRVKVGTETKYIALYNTKTS